MSKSGVSAHPPRGCRLIEDWHNFIGTSPIFDPNNWEPYSAPQLREIIRVLDPIHDDRARFPLPDRLGDARRAHRLCMASLERGKIETARRLCRYLANLLRDASRREDIEDANARRRSNAGLRKSAPSGQPAETARKIHQLAEKYPDNRNRASKIARQLGCSPGYVRKILRKK